jgi:RNAse (barnase) inhibitor barstar
VALDTIGQATSEAVHFIGPDDAGPLREELLRTSHLYEIGEPVTDRAALFRALSETMQFPAYFGHNWDAVDECLCDLVPPQRKGVVLMLHHAEELWTKDPRTGGELIETWLGAVERWRKDGIPFHLVFVW